MYDVHLIAYIGRVTKRKAASRDRIVAVAIKLYLKGGLNAITMRRIARELKLTPMALYRHFRNKQEVLATIIDEGFRIFGSYQYRALEGKTAAERLLLTGEAFIDFILKEPQFFKVIFMAPDIVASAQVPEEISARARATYQFLVDRVGEGMREGVLRAGDAEKVAKTIWGLSHGLGSLYLAQMLETDENGFREIFMASFGNLAEGIFVDAPK